MNNQYQPQSGFISTHGMAITGYGITLNTLNWFLINHHLSINPSEVDPMQDFDANQNEIENYLNDDANQTLNDLHLETEYFGSESDEFKGFLIYDLPIIDHPKQQLTIERANQDLIKAIQYLYDISDDLRTDLTALIEQYANEINACELN